MSDLENGENSQRRVGGKDWNDAKFFWGNYIVIAVLNSFQFGLTIYGSLPSGIS
jgi:hypothetical protein